MRDKLRLKRVVNSATPDSDLNFTCAGYLRHSLQSKLGQTGITVRDGLCNVLPPDVCTTPGARKGGGRFICPDCYSLLQKVTVGKTCESLFFERMECGSYVEGKKRKTLQSTPAKSPYVGKRRKVDVATSPMFHSPKRQIKIRQNWKARAKRFLTASKYKSLFITLYRHSSRAAREFEDAVHILVKSEMSGFQLCRRTLQQPVTLETVKNFSWNNVLPELSSNMPVLFNSVCAACTPEKVTDILKNKKIPSRAGIGNLISSALFIRKHKKYNFVAALHAVEMWRSGGSHKLFECFNHLGMSLGVDATRNRVDKLCAAFDSMIMDWKTQIEDGRLKKDASALSKKRRRRLDFQDEMPEEKSDDAKEDVMGYSFCWDNVQIDTTARHQSKERQSKTLLWAQCFATENRVSTTHLECSTANREEEELVSAKKIPLQSFLPSREDFRSLKKRMAVIVARILCKNFHYFQDMLEISVPLHIEHKYSTEMKRKSNICNLGVIETNPSSTEGAIQILEHLSKYLPRTADDSPHKAVCFGDGLSVERMVDAKKSRATGLDEWERLESFEPSPQEFHKRMLLMQDIMTELFTGRSGADRGTLFHIKNTFNKRSVKKDVKDAFNHDAEFLQFVTEGFVCLFCKSITGLSLDDENGPGLDDADRSNFLLDVSEQIVNRVWHEVPEENLLEVLTAYVPVAGDDGGDEDDDDDDWLDFQYCLCKNDTGEVMVECSNPDCKHGHWFHLPCVGVTDVPDGDWWCSTECRQSQASIYCVCKKVRPELEMRRCALKEHCQQGEFFHIKCISTSHTSTGTGRTWYCSTACRKAKNKKSVDVKPDSIYKHSCAIVWGGLNDLVRRDAVREGDGDAMICHWKIDMLQFWKRNHYKYLILGHRLLAGQNGWLPKRLAEDMRWNRTANLQGHEGCNLGLDLVNEFINNDFKENLKHARGMYSQKHVARTSQIVGTLGAAIDKVYQREVASTYVHSSGYTNKPSIRNEVLLFVEEYEDDKLVEIIPDRQHSAFPNYCHNVEVSDPSGLKKRLKTYSGRLQKQRDILPQQ